MGGLRQTTFEDALACITDANLAGGHSFLLFDAEGNGASIEATNTAVIVDRLDREPLIHTNHCLFPETMAVEEERPADLDQNSKQRLKDAISLVASTPEHTPSSLMALLRDENSICRHPEPPYTYESSGAVIMRPRTLELWACWGIPSENQFERFTLT